MDAYFFRNAARATPVTDWIKAQESGFPRVEEAVRACEWVLARNPRAGMPVGNGKFLYTQLAGDAEGIPDFWVTYSFTETDLVLHHIGDDELFF